ncbi:glycosyltransferase [Gracilimonas mengyeensis]|uniref:Glycosyltransferase involved in cell wall bisynthesis n=1 Tax=Gracilimonas mengyeensis TaxID=1302730 RepID=A0A521AB02_9BACT|nr:glycosyltransferase [Gracilimonas mengyeensis]SMO31994.1 Glycosyltransferase involved in cell wall bisynthesis [Gracilimonas mengyeensis]
MKNVLVIVYYFPPMGGSGVQRPLKFVKYLRDFGWDPIILCPEPGAYHTFDQSLMEEVHNANLQVFRVPVDTPFHKTGQKQKQVRIPPAIAKILRWFSSFFFLPDNKKKWIEPGLEAAMKIIEEQDIDLIFSSAPPYSNLMLAKSIKQKTGLPVVMDLRDDWLESHLIKYPTRWHKNRMRQLEAETLSEADGLLTINERIAQSLKERTQKEVEVIGHGYDPEDFKGLGADQYPPNKKLTFLYSGTFYPDSRPDTFLRAWAELLKESPSLKERVELQFQGRLENAHWKLINELNLKDLVVDFGYVDHDTAVRNLLRADVLWLIVGHKKNAEIISLGKTSEYFAARKPILGLVPKGSARDMLLNYGNAFIAAPYHISQIKKQLEVILKHKRNGDWPEPSEEVIQSFNRRKLTGELTRMFDQINSR